MKRTATAIFDQGGFIRRIDNLGPQKLPFKVSKHGLVNTAGNAFVLKFDVKPPALQDLKEEFGRDVDIIKQGIFRVQEPEKVECTLQDELQPPAYRKEVIEMINVAKRKQKEKYPQNTGLSYYPFQK